MGKRFSDTEIWRKEWFCNLSPALKTFWRYICDNCDNSGVWEMNLPLAEFQIGCKISLDDILSDFHGNIRRLSENKLLVVDFIQFQYGELKKDCIPHRNVFNLLKKHNIIYPIDRVLDTLKDKDKDKDKDISLEKKENEKEKPFWRTSFVEYEKQASDAWDRLVSDAEWMQERKRYHPNLDIRLSLEKAFNDFWGTEAGWAHKKKSRVKEIDWNSTFKNALTLKGNQVWEKRTTVLGK